MFDLIIVWVSVYALWLAIALSAVLFFLRLYYSVDTKLEWKQTLLVVLIPLSIGYFEAFPQKTKRKTLYQSLIMVQFVMVLLGFIVVFYARYM